MIFSKRQRMEAHIVLQVFKQSGQTVNWMTLLCHHHISQRITLKVKLTGTGASLFYFRIVSLNIWKVAANDLQRKLCKPWEENSICLKWWPFVEYSVTPTMIAVNIKTHAKVYRASLYGAALPPWICHFAATDSIFGTKPFILLITFLSWRGQNPVIKTAKPNPQVQARDTEFALLKSPIKMSKLESLYHFPGCFLFTSFHLYILGPNFIL